MIQMEYMRKNVKISPRLNQSLLTSLTTSLLLSNLLLRQPHSIWCSAGPISMEIIQQIFWGKAKSNANASGILDASWDFGWYVMHLCKCPKLRRVKDASYEKYFFFKNWRFSCRTTSDTVCLCASKCLILQEYESDTKKTMQKL